MADGSVVVHEVAPRMTKNQPKAESKISKPLPAIDEVEVDEVRRSKVVGK